MAVKTIKWDDAIVNDLRVGHEMIDLTKPISVGQIVHGKYQGKLINVTVRQIETDAIVGVVSTIEPPVKTAGDLHVGDCVRLPHASRTGRSG